MNTLQYNNKITVQKYSFRFMVHNAIFNNMSVISWRSVLLVEETGVPRESHQPVVIGH
jgi:hypothetical protein